MNIYAGTLNGAKGCIDDCLTCEAICLEELTEHCLKVGGKHAQQDHIRLMMNCADICHTCARFMMTESDFHSKTCAICADICEACAKSCEKVGDMERCVEACRNCAETCRSMA